MNLFFQIHLHLKVAAEALPSNYLSLRKSMRIPTMMKTKRFMSMMSMKLSTNLKKLQIATNLLLRNQVATTLPANLRSKITSSQPQWLTFLIRVRMIPQVLTLLAMTMMTLPSAIWKIGILGHVWSANSPTLLTFGIVAPATKNVKVNIDRCPNKFRMKY